MPVRFTVTTKGFDKATNTLSNLVNKLDDAVGEGVTTSGHELRNALNVRIAEFGNKCEVYPISKKEIVIAPSIERIEEIMDVPDWQKFDAARRCVYFGYRRFIEQRERISLPLVSLSIQEVYSVVRMMIPVIRGIMITSIKNVIGG